MSEPISRYAALPLQVACRAVNRCATADEARARMLETIAHCDALLGGAKSFIRSFSGDELRLVVLPEYFLSGFPMGEDVASWQRRACINADGPEYAAIAELARRHGVYLSGNVYELDPHFPELYFQASFIVDEKGEVVLRYRRLISMFSPTPHDVLDLYLEAYGADSLFPVVDTPLGRLACVASEEILFPEISRALALRGAEVLCHSSSEVGSPRLTPKNIAKRARAIENLAYVVSANSAGIRDIDLPGQSTDGHSQVVDGKGRVLAEAGPGESISGHAAIDIDGLRRLRATPAMTNLLARQRLELFAGTYADAPVYPANTLAAGRSVEPPGRAHYLDVQRAVIRALRERGVI